MADTEVLKLVELADNWIGQKTGEVLDDAQKAILQQALAGRRLKDIQVTGYTGNTVQREIAPKLWKLLSQVTGKRVSIKTVRLVLEGLREEPSPSGSWGVRQRGGAGVVNSASPHTPLEQTSPDLPPEGLELPGGQLELASKFYIERPPIETRAFEEISKPGSLIRIKAPKRMGKTSLITRLLHKAEQLGCRSVALNFELADSEVFTNLDKFLQWFCAIVTDDLELPIQLESRWSKFLGSKKNCTNYFEKYLLPAIDTPLALGLDEVDRIFPHEKIADDFFGLLRAWHEKAKQSDIWKNFRLIIVHGTEVYIPLSNDQSPFNVGLPVELPEFNSAQVRDLAHRHGLDLTGTQVEQLMAMVGGHPHLVRLALYKIARQDVSLEDLLRDAPTETGIYANHLRQHLRHLEQHPELASAFKQVVETDSPVQLMPAIAYKLNSMGLVRLLGNQVTVAYDLYRQYFRQRWLGSDLLNASPLSL
ncbi:MAG: AAA-like domain-containing protein [Oscillatoria sp. Prado101]|jgi:hypothetical protein|nr:AAA-like domain-containing protein [Oscillatoria sp. Prado101]